MYIAQHGPCAVKVFLASFCKIFDWIICSCWGNVLVLSLGTNFGKFGICFLYRKDNECIANKWMYNSFILLGEGWAEIEQRENKKE